MKKIFILCLISSMLLCGCGDDKDTKEYEFNATEWVANPANPASPVHQVLFH